MRRRTIAPILLLVAAAFASAAVFAVHDIEETGGPLAQPFNTPFVSPGLDDHRGEAIIRFTTQAPERVTVRIVDSDGRVVRTFIDDQRLDGPTSRTWDGTDDAGELVPDGTYRVHITRRGDARVYEPTKPLVIDTEPPVARLELVRAEDGKVIGLVLLEPHAVFQVEDASGDEVEGLRTWRPGRGTEAISPPADRPPNTNAVAFTVPFDPEGGGSIDDLTFVALDRAGNRTELQVPEEGG